MNDTFPIFALLWLTGLYGLDSVPGLWESVEMQSKCDEATRLRYLSYVGTVNETIEIYHARKVITNMPAPRGVNFLVARQGSIVKVLDIGCSMITTDITIETNTIDPGLGIAYRFDGIDVITALPIEDGAGR